MKKLYRLSTLSVSLLTASLLVASTASFATPSYKGEAAPSYKDQAPCPQPLMLKDGFYVGGQVGYDAYRMATSLNASSGGVTATSGGSVGANGWVGGLFLGYGQYFNNLAYLGLEIFGNDSGASQSFNSTATSSAGFSSSTSGKVSVNGSYGISVLPGIKMNDATLGYIRLGYNRANIKTSGSATITAPAAGVPAGTSVGGSNNNNWRGGFNYGLGMETAFYENWSARAEYTRTNYQSFSSSITSVTPYDNQFMLGLIYHFA